MEDLRKNFNVKKSNSNVLATIGALLFNRRILSRIITIAAVVLVIFFPSLVGTHVSVWLNDLYTSFMAHNSISLETWAITVGTIFSGLLFYGLLKWINRN